MSKPDPVLRAFGFSVKRHREAKELTQEQLAEKADLDRTLIISNAVPPLVGEAIRLNEGRRRRLRFDRVLWALHLDAALNERRTAIDEELRG